jgi:hypothetical protein
MQDEVPLTILEQLCSDPAMIFQQDAIDKIAVSGLDIWNKSNTNMNAHQTPLTFFANERSKNMLPRLLPVHSTTMSAW